MSDQTTENDDERPSEDDGGQKKDTINDPLTRSGTDAPKEGWGSGSSA